MTWVPEACTGCCSFFVFDLRTSAAGTQLEVRVPPAQVAVLDAMEQRAETARDAREVPGARSTLTP